MYELMRATLVAEQINIDENKNQSGGILPGSQFKSFRK